ncbi:amidohydrolase [Seminavis robusta]|uniref:Amidohydrolase n=1 Tax=Seminavis robusta TaxID=568900 RepID=A0A9N8EJZ1_9STRA|nr:amidohydrolase [Seminavis robusta]|eukprot:Sro1227_g254340.1 amidohydrolase (201) ;mRNA; f:27002-27604
MIQTNNAALHLSHAVMAHPKDLARLAQIPGASVDFSPALGVVVPELEGLMKAPVGEKRYQSQLNVRAAVEAGAATGLGSDWPSSIIPEPNSFWYLQTWITRKLPGRGSTKAHNIKQAISVEQAIEACTLGSAKCMGFDWPSKVGSIETGKLADFIVLDRNLFEIPVETIADVLVDRTVVSGKVVFDRFLEEDNLDVVKVR